VEDAAQSPTPLSDDEILIRRMPPGHMTAEEHHRPNTDGFSDSPDGHMSVYVESRLAAMGLKVTAVLEGHPGFGLVAFSVGLIRDLGWDVVIGGADPSDPWADAHADVVGDKRARAPRKRLAKECHLVVWPPLSIAPEGWGK
jgi:hypothetical protein